MRLIHLPTLLLFLVSAPIQAATYIVGTCPGATHSDFATAYNQLGTTGGQPHTLRLCPGTHSTASLSANWGHAGLTIESVSGSPNNTLLDAGGANVFTATSEGFNIRNLAVNGNLVATEWAPVSFQGSLITGAIRTNAAITVSFSIVDGTLTSNGAEINVANSEVSGLVQAQGNIAIASSTLNSGAASPGWGIINIQHSEVSGPLQGPNGVTVSNSTVSGNITATNGAIALSYTLYEGDISTGGNAQPISLEHVEMPSGSLQTTGNTITINASVLGSASSSVPIQTNNNIQVSDALIWGNLNAATNYSSIFLDPDTLVNGICTPNPIGGGICQTVSGSCSGLIGGATINEVHAQGNSNRFIELRILSPSIGAAEFQSWTLRLCSSRRSPCISVPLNDASFDHSGYPWLVLTEGGIPHQNYIDFGQGGQSNGMEVRLDDASGRAIDYLSVDGYSDQLAVNCPFQYDTTMTRTNSFTIMRLPDGTGNWTTSGPGNSGTPTPGGSNDGSEPDFGPEHIRLLHPGSGVTCAASEITVVACADANCNEQYTNPVTVNFTSPAGNWSPAATTFTGQTTVSLQVTTPGSVVLAASSDPGAPVRCFEGAIESCSMTWSSSGFLIDVPDHVAASSVSGSIRAVRADDESQACLPAFSNVSREIRLWSRFDNPSTGQASVIVNGTTLPHTEPGAATLLNFDSQGSAPLSLVYADVGSKRLQARFEGSGDEAGLVMLGAGEFIARPAGFVLQVSDNPAAGSAAGPVFKAAGQPFSMVVFALNAANQVTPNFGRETPAEGVVLSQELIAPAIGENPSLTGAFSDFGSACAEHAAAPGTACGEFRFGEVGILRLQPRLQSGSYLGSGNAVGAWSEPIGRFVPDHFALSGASLIDRAAVPGCDSDFTYVGEALATEFSLLAQAASGTLTANYQGSFARLEESQLGLGATPSPEIEQPQIEWTAGIGQAVAMIRVDRHGPVAPIDPFVVTINPVDSDGVGLVGSGLIGESRLLFGRVVMDSAIGSELGPLDLPWRIELWSNDTWQVNGSDQCTHFALADDISLRNGHGDEVVGTDSISVDGGGATTSVIVDQSALTADSGRGHFRLSAPLAPGWIELGPDLQTTWPYLRDDLNDNDSFIDNPSARATFGLFDGNSQRILLREIMPR